jgi:hypothetical protein
MERTALDLSVAPQTLAKPREGIFANNLKLYIGILLAVVVASYAAWVRERSIFACPASGYSADRYLAYCNGANYGDYEHGAFWFGLEPVLGYANKADVLFLGNSRMEMAFSMTATSVWFSAASARYYLMGFSYGENMTFAGPLLRKIKPRASVYVINVDDFFDQTETPPGKTVMDDPQGRSRYDGKRFWQHVQERVCGTFGKLCGLKGATFRSRETGAYTMREQPYNVPVSDDETVSQDEVDRGAAAAKDFLKEFTQGKCVILTEVPTVDGKIGYAKAVAAALGMKLVAPEVPGEVLQTGDGSHLKAASAQRWSEAFFQAAGPEIQSYLEKRRANAS